MDALYVEGIEDILAIATGPSACNSEPLENGRPDGTVVKASVLGEELDAGECELLAAMMEVRHLSPGERLVTEGDVDNRLVLVAAGKVAVLSNIDGREIGVYTMTRGECAGTRAFVDGTPRKATLEAVHGATVYTLKPEIIGVVHRSAPDNGLQDDAGPVQSDSQQPYAGQPGAATTDQLHHPRLRSLLIVRKAANGQVLLFVMPH